MPTSNRLRWMAALGLLLLTQTALADLMLFPTRIVFDKQRAAQVELMNQGTAPETYRISLVNRRMGPNGEFIAITEPGAGEQFADEMVRFSPHQVTIPPGGSQLVRIVLRKPADLAAGEYRSHLQFDRVAEARGDSSIEDLARHNNGEVGVVINTLVGASIPVIVRQGNPSAQLSLSDLQLLPANGAAPGGSLSLQMNRTGNASAYGDLLVTFTTPAGVIFEVAKAGGVAVYVPNATRHAVLPLHLPTGSALPGGTLKVSYRDRPEAGGKLLAEASLTVP